MKRFTQTGRKNPLIRDTACELIRHLPNKAFRQEAETLFSFVQNEIRYVKDIRDVETLHTADQVLAQGYGDCDDMAILLASLLESVGHKTKFEAIGFSPGILSHVIVKTQIGQKWIAADPTENVPFGWEPPNIKTRLERFV